MNTGEKVTINKTIGDIKKKIIEGTKYGKNIILTISTSKHWHDFRCY